MSATTGSWVRVGRIGKTFGLKGEVVIHYFADAPDRFAAGARVHVVTPEGRVETTVARSRAMTGKFVAAFEGREAIDAVQPWVGCFVEVPASELPPLPEGTYYQFQLVGLEVLGVGGERLGRIEEVLGTGGNDVLVVRGGRREILVPVIEDAIASIDPAAGRVVLKDLGGLIEP